MKNLSILHRMVATALVACALAMPVWAANKKKTVEQVSAPVTLTDDLDYIVTSETPFTGEGMVNIANTEHAVLILYNVKPSKATSLLKYVQINGVKAVNNSNCQVKLYNRGCIILPYSKDLKPLTVYSEPNYGGESCNDFGLENSGGFMNTLSEEKLNNRIRSFKLKRGYMVTFSNRAKGRGYSRCFIAADKDLEMAKLPGVLDRSISSYRVFKWYDTGKQALANDTRATAVSAMNVTSCYSFGAGESRLPDAECVPHHIYEDWPTAAACGQVTYSPHLKTNNEPGNSADDHPQTVKTILDNWENLMATGMRLCSPSSHDGSLWHLREFLDSVDARGWRCDIIDLHCYWPESSFSDWSFNNQWATAYGRPIWISEWVWGASWNTNGAFADGVTENQNRDAVKRICEKLNGFSSIERYYYWNSERDPSRLFKTDEKGNINKITSTGKYYATIDGGLAYTGKNNYVPKLPKLGDPSGLAVTYESSTGVATLTWHEPNGELNIGIYVDRKDGSGSSWTEIADIPMAETAADYTFVDEKSFFGSSYRIRVVDPNNKERTTKAVVAVATGLAAGDAIPTDNGTKYLGGNLLVNGDFDLGTVGWTNGTGGPIGQPWYQVVPVGGADGGSYLQTYTNGGRNTEQSISVVYDVKPHAAYYFSGATCNNTGVQQQVRLSGVADKDSLAAYVYNTGSIWNSSFTIFETNDFTKATVALYKSGCKTQFDKLLLCQLFDNRDDAIADGIAKARLKAEAFMAFNKLSEGLNTELATLFGQLPQTGENARKQADVAVATAITAYGKKISLDSLVTVAKAVLPFAMPGQEQLQATVQQAEAAATADAIIRAEQTLRQQLDDYLPLTAVEDGIKSADFANANGWVTKCGTYTGGDQRTNEQDGVTFWNAWWSGISAAQGTAMNMTVKQDVTELTHGIYALECKATTEHYCLSDQHAFITVGSDTVVSPVLTANYFDLPTVDVTQRWETLTTLPLYVGDGETLTVGFTGSKQGAVDNAWHKVGNVTNKGDQREGWWCATDFVLLYHPQYRRSCTPGEWGCICLPYAVKRSDGLHFYEIKGITSDLKRICIEEVEEVAAGTPFIYKADKADIVFFEYGAIKNAAVAGSGNLRGYLSATGSSRVPKNYYVLTDGQWVKVDPNNRPALTKYLGVMRAFDDALSKLPTIYDEWNGLTLPIVGISDAEVALLTATGIGGVENTTVNSKAETYTIDGRRVDSKAVKGLLIKKENGHTRKTVVK